MLIKSKVQETVCWISKYVYYDKWFMGINIPWTPQIKYLKPSCFLSGEWWFNILQALQLIKVRSLLRANLVSAWSCVRALWTGDSPHSLVSRYGKIGRG